MRSLLGRLSAGKGTALALIRRGDKESLRVAAVELKRVAVGAALVTRSFPFAAIALTSGPMAKIKTR